MAGNARPVLYVTLSVWPTGLVYVFGRKLCRHRTEWRLLYRGVNMYKMLVNTALMPVARLAMVVVCAALFCVPAMAKKEALPEVDKDGLHLLKDTKVSVAYAKPGASLAPYDKVQLLDCFVDFQKDWQRDYNMNEIGLEGRVTDKDAEAIKKRLADEFSKVFTEVLTKKGFEVVDDTGPDVLLLRPALINVDVAAPDTRSAGMGRTFVRSAGAMTLYMELYDSASSELLARVVDPQGDRNTMGMASDRATNKAAADRILRSWAELLAKHLGEVKHVTK